MSRFRLSRGDWALWPWQRCPKRLERETALSHGLDRWGRCDLHKDSQHEIHAIEHGFNVVMFDDAGRPL